MLSSDEQALIAEAEAHMRRHALVLKLRWVIPMVALFVAVMVAGMLWVTQSGGGGSEPCTTKADAPTLGCFR